MKKTKYIFLNLVVHLLVLVTPYQTWCQWNNLNILVTDKNVDMTQHLTSASGLTFIGFDHFDPINEVDSLFVQILDKNGNRLLGDGGLFLMKKEGTWSTSAMQLRLDAADNCYLCFNFPDFGTVLFKIDKNGNLLTPGGIIIDQVATSDLQITAEQEMVVVTKQHLKKLSADGDLIWDIDLSLTPEIGTNNIIRGVLRLLPNGDFYLLSGISIPTIAGYLNFYLQLYDADGKPKWEGMQHVDIEKRLSKFSVPAHLEVVGMDAVVTLDIIIDINSSRLFAQRFEPDGIRKWGNNLVPIFDFDYTTTCKVHDIKIANDLQHLFVMSTEVMDNSSNSEVSAIIFQSLDLNDGHPLNTKNGTVVIPFSESKPESTTIKQCGNTLVIDVIEVKSKHISLVKLNLDGKVIISYPIKLTANNISISLATDELFGIDNSGQAVVVFPENRTGNEGEFQLFAQSKEVCNRLLTLPETANKSIVCFPNPATNEIYIRTQADLIVHYSIYDEVGKQLLSLPFTSNKIDVLSLCNGLYFIHFKTSNGTIIRKVEIQK